MKDLLKRFMEAITMHSQSTGMTFIRKFGRSPLPGQTIIVFCTMLSVPNEEADKIEGEWHSPTLATCGIGDEVVVMAVSTGEGHSIKELSRGNGLDGLLRETIWRF
jgi:hypothetical protein